MRVEVIATLVPLLAPSRIRFKWLRERKRRDKQAVLAPLRALHQQLRLINFLLESCELYDEVGLDQEHHAGISDRTYPKCMGS